MRSDSIRAIPPASVSLIPERGLLSSWRDRHRDRYSCILAAALALLLSASATSAAAESWTFVRGINLNGDTVVIDGQRYEADRDAKDFVCRDSRFENQKVALQPATDEARAKMIRSSRWQADGKNSITLTNVSNGRYHVYLYTWEDTDPERFTISLEGRPVLQDYNSGRAGTWKKLGPWDVTVDDGTLDLTCQGGHANLSGLELWRQTDGAVAAADAPSRSGLLALYLFDETQGAIVHDRSGVGQPLDLTIADPSKVAWNDGRLTIRAATRIASSKPAAKIVDAVRRSGALTVEAWLRPAGTKQSGPARIVTISGDPNRRNLTLGQDGDRFDVRLRTSSTSTNGIPSVATGSKTVDKDLTHVVYTRDRTGQARIFVDGRQQRDERVAGDLRNWDPSFRLALTNELSGDRGWLGDLHAVAIYGRALSPSEVAQSFRQGAVNAQQRLAGGPGQTASAAERMFEAEIAPILARHCLECHDGATKKGGLDLSRREHALKGGESGEAFVAGKPSGSLLFELVASDDMPADREPLSDLEKK
ncbi:MAG: LamG-like jellyroll fold domain-containing protein, partial [Maioricimonas sp. JB049]